jgi:hypothetical protein
MPCVCLAGPDLKIRRGLHDYQESLLSMPRPDTVPTVNIQDIYKIDIIIL